MRVGHIHLARSFNGTGEHFIALIESLDRQGISQHVIVSNEALARRLSVYEKVSVGPTTSAAVVAYCLMPPVDIVHCHEERSGQAGLLLRLTRSIPFVLTRRLAADPNRNPVHRSVYRRAARVVCTTDAGARALENFIPDCRLTVIRDLSRAAADDFDAVVDRGAGRHLQLYRHAIGSPELRALLL